MQLKIVTFNMEISDQEQIFGFKILPMKEALSFKKAVKKLEDQQSVFYFGENEYIWSSEFFTFNKINTMQSKILDNIFDLDIQTGISKNIGFIPDPIQQAYQEGLLDQNQTELLDEQADEEEQF